MWGVDKKAIFMFYSLFIPKNGKQNKFSMGLRATLLQRYP